MEPDTEIDQAQLRFQDGISSSPGTEQGYILEVLRYSVVDSDTEEGQPQTLGRQRLNLGPGKDQR